MWTAGLLLDGLTLLVTDGPAAAAPVLRQATSTFADPKVPVAERLRWGWMATMVGAALWDDEGYRLIEWPVQLAGKVGALDRLPMLLNQLATAAVWRGEFAAAASLIAEADAVCEATGARIAPYAAMRLAASRGREADAAPLIQATIEQAAAAGQGAAVTSAHWAAATLYNGLGRYAEAHPQLSLPWSSKALRACYQQGAERFGWSHRSPEPGSMRDGYWLVGYGMAGVSYLWGQLPCQARASISRDGNAFVRSAATDIGTGTYTIMTQLSADILGLGLDRVRFDLGDTDMPMAPPAGGSALTAALGSAVHAACRQLVRIFLDTVADDPDSPLQGCRLDQVTAAGGRIHRTGQPNQGEAYTDILARHRLGELTAEAASAPPKPQDVGLAPAGPFAAKFVEVRVDPDLGLVRVARVVSAIDGGRILNEKTVRSQIIGGTVGGIGMALLEQTISDPSGRIANATFSDYLVAVNADVPDMDVLFVGEPPGLAIMCAQAPSATSRKPRSPLAARGDRLHRDTRAD